MSETVPADRLQGSKAFFEVVLEEGGEFSNVGETSVKLYEYDTDVAKLEDDLHVKMPTLDKFYSTLQDLLADAQKRETDPVSIVQEYPPEPFQSDEIITWRLISRKPAMMNRKGTGRPQAKFRSMDTITTAALPNHTYIIRNRPLDHILEFTCWGKSNKIANRRALWLEKLLISWAWVFYAIGVEDFRFDGRLADLYQRVGEAKLYARPLRFKMRLREYDIVAQPNIRKLRVEVQTS